MTIRISDIIDTSGVIEAALEHKLMTITSRTKNLPNIDTFMKVIGNTIEDMVSTHIAGEVMDKVTPMFEEYEMLNGPRDTAASPDEWDSGLDDALENSIEEYMPVLSADWLGRNAIGTMLHEEGAIQKFCDSLGKEYFKQITWEGQKSPAKVMSSAGITKAEAEEALANHLENANQKGETTMAEDNATLDAVIAKIAAHVGKDYDQLTIYDDFDQASDDDDILAQGAGARLGLDAADIEVLQGERMMHGAETPDVLTKAFEAHFGETVEGTPAKKGKAAGKKAAAKGAAAEASTPAPTAPKKAAGTAKKNAAAKKAPPADDSEDAAAAAEGEGVVDADVLQTLKKCGAVDTEMSAGMGVSRATYNNWANGKTEFTLNEKQLDFLRNEIVSRVTMLLEALAKVDGSAEPQAYIL